MRFKNVLDFLLGIIYPEHCVCCNKEIAYNKTFCDDCKLLLNDAPVNISTSGLAISKIHARYVYKSPASDIVKTYKFKHKKAYSDILSQWVYEAFIANCSASDYDIATCVPMTNKEMKEKGFNHNALILKKFAEKANIKYDPNLLLKTRETSMQVRLGAKDRMENMKNLYIASEENVKGLRILVIDDVFTTGATMNECARAFLTAGAIKVEAICATVSIKTY